MPSHEKHSGGRRGALVAAAATVVLAGLGAALILTGSGSGSGIQERPESAALARPGPTKTAGQNASAQDAGDAAGAGGSRTGSRAVDRDEARPEFGPVLTGSPPVGLGIPRIGVHSTDIVDLGFQKDGSIEVPLDPDSPGWFTPGPSPGQVGPAVIAGHVDGESGPAVFYRLGELRPGDRVTVDRQDGTTATFVIDRVETFEKDAFPTREVYGSTDRAELRLITCSGQYDDEEGYLSNTVAFAHLR
jgi:hypothetical protein